MSLQWINNLMKMNNEKEFMYIYKESVMQWKKMSQKYIN